MIPVQRTSALSYSDCSSTIGGAFSITNAVTNSTSQVARNILEVSATYVGSSSETQCQELYTQRMSFFDDDRNSLQQILEKLSSGSLHSLPLREIKLLKQCIHAFKSIVQRSPQLIRLEVHRQVVERLASYVQSLIRSGTIEQVVEVLKSCSMLDHSAPSIEQAPGAWITEAIEQGNPAMLQAVLENYTNPSYCLQTRFISVATKAENPDLLRTVLKYLKSKDCCVKDSVICAFSVTMEATASTTSLLLDELTELGLIAVARELIKTELGSNTEARQNRSALLSLVFQRISASECTFISSALEGIFEVLLLHDDDSLKSVFNFIDLYPSVCNLESLIGQAQQAAQTGNRQLFSRTLALLDRLAISQLELERFILSLKAATDSIERNELLLLVEKCFVVDTFAVLLSDPHLDTAFLISMLEAELQNGRKREGRLETLFEKIQKKTLSPAESEKFVDCLVLKLTRERPSWLDLYQFFFPNSIPLIIDSALAVYDDANRFQKLWLLLKHLGLSSSQTTSFLERRVLLLLAKNAIEEENLRALRTALQKDLKLTDKQLHPLIRLASKARDPNVLTTLLQVLKAKEYFLEESVIQVFSPTTDSTLMTTNLLLDELKGLSLIRLVHKLIETELESHPETRQNLLALLSNIFKRIHCARVTSTQLDNLLKSLLLQSDDRFEWVLNFIQENGSEYTVERLIEKATKAVETGSMRLFSKILVVLTHLKISRSELESLVLSVKATTNGRQQRESVALLTTVFGFDVFEIVLSDDNLDTSLLISMLSNMLARDNQSDVVLQTLFERIKDKRLSAKESATFVNYLTQTSAEERPRWLHLYQRFFPNYTPSIIDLAIRLATNHTWRWFEQTLLLLRHLEVSESQLRSLFTRIQGLREDALMLFRRIFPSFQNRASNVDQEAATRKKALEKKKASGVVTRQQKRSSLDRESKEKDKMKEETAICSRVGSRKRKLPQEAS